jgi:hypothetical protein
VPSGHAQDTAPAGACASIESDAERLACYDRALRATRTPATSATPAAQAAPPAAGAGAAGAAAATAGGAASNAGAAPAAAATPPPTQVNVQAPSSSISTAPRTSTRNAVAPSPQPPPTIGPNAAPPVGIVPIIVLSARAAPGRGVEFTTDKGDVWVQSDAQPLQLPPTPFNAQIKPGSFGSTFLVPENRLGIRVRHHD